MNDFLDRISVGQIAVVSSLSWLVDWLAANQIITMLSFFTLTLSALLAIRKVLMLVKKDSIYATELIIKWTKDKEANKNKENIKDTENGQTD